MKRPPRSNDNTDRLQRSLERLADPHAQPSERVEETPPPDGRDAPEKQETEKPAGERGETGGPSGPGPTRYGDWERKGRCIDF